MLLNTILLSTHYEFYLRIISVTLIMQSIPHFCGLEETQDESVLTADGSTRAGKFTFFRRPPISSGENRRDPNPPPTEALIPEPQWGARSQPRVESSATLGHTRSHITSSPDGALGVSGWGKNTRHVGDNGIFRQMESFTPKSLVGWAYLRAR